MVVVAAVFGQLFLQTGSGALRSCRLFELRRATHWTQVLWTMALDTLRYGNYRPTYVASDSKSLPGYGGEVQGWADYKFAVQAIRKKESQISEGEKKKLGPLALRLTERLVGPALQVAKKLGVDKLSEDSGVETLLSELESQLLPLRKQAALDSTPRA